MDHPSHSPQLSSLIERAEADPNVVGLVLTGSQARRGMATEQSDIDVYVVLAVSDDGWRTTRSADIDLPVCTLEQLRHVPGINEPDGWWDRYSFTHAQILLDRSGGELPRLVEAWGTLSGAESKSVLESQLDGYINFAYRSLKSHRDGRDFEARMDASESLPWALAVIFALQRRVRPYNKYLRWELENHPLNGDEWESAELLALFDSIVRAGDATAQRDLFRRVAAAASEVGLGGIVEAWHDELTFLRGDER